MIELLIIILLLNYLFSSKVPTNYLACGIFGWNGKAASTFNLEKLKILGLYNNSRGGDGCGIFINEKIIKGIGTRSDFNDFIEDIKIPKNEASKSIIGHARKASVGNKILANTQPLGILSKDQKDGIVIAHNGTLKNHQELLQEYKLSNDGINTDSQALATLLLLKGWEVLGKYEGAAALLITKLSEPDVMYVFKGASKSYKSDTKLTDERPLYMLQEHKNSVYFSSMENSLEAITDDNSLITPVKENILYKVENGVVKEHVKIDRSSFVQKSYTGTTTYDNWDYGRNHHRQTKISHCNPDFGGNTKLNDNIRPKEFYYMHRLCYYRGAYWAQEKKASGAYVVNEEGKAYPFNTDYKKEIESMVKDSEGAIRILYFINGNLMIDEENYMKALKKLYKFDVKREDDKATTDYLYEDYKAISEHTVYPVCNYSDASGVISYAYAKDKTANTNDAYKVRIFSGAFKPMFCDTEYSFNVGDMKSIIRLASKFFPDFKKDTVSLAYKTHKGLPYSDLPFDKFKGFEEEDSEDEKDTSIQDRAHDLAVRDYTESEIIANMLEEDNNSIVAEESKKVLDTAAAYIRKALTELENSTLMDESQMLSDFYNSLNDLLVQNDNLPF